MKLSQSWVTQDITSRTSSQGITHDVHLQSVLKAVSGVQCDVGCCECDNEHHYVSYKQCICRLADYLLTFCVLVSPFPSNIYVCVESSIVFHFHPVIWFSVVWVTDAVLKCTNTVFSLTVLSFILSLCLIPVCCSASPTLLWPMGSR